jgi:uridine kinase
MDRSRCLSELVAVIVHRHRSHPTRVAIDGVDGVGKTTLADELAESLRAAGREVIRASVDGFHNPRARRYVRGSDSAEGYFLDSFNYETLERELLQPLGPGGSRSYRRTVFDYRTDSEADAVRETASPTAVLLFDGVFLQRPELRPHWDIAIWMDAPFGVTVDRAIQRDAVNDREAEALRELYDQRYVPGQRIYMERCQPERLADVVVDNRDPSNPRLEIRSV